MEVNQNPSSAHTEIWASLDPTPKLAAGPHFSWKLLRDTVGEEEIISMTKDPKWKLQQFKDVLFFLITFCNLSSSQEDQLLLGFKTVDDNSLANKIYTCSSNQALLEACSMFVPNDMLESQDCSIRLDNTNIAPKRNLVKKCCQLHKHLCLPCVAAQSSTLSFPEKLWKVFSQNILTSLGTFLSCFFKPNCSFSLQTVLKDLFCSSVYSLAINSWW